MKDFNQLYQNAKNRANNLMLKGQITAYVAALREMNQYKKMVLAVASN
jgi:hypothetical protein